MKVHEHAKQLRDQHGDDAWAGFLAGGIVTEWVIGKCHEFLRHHPIGRSANSTRNGNRVTFSWDGTSVILAAGEEERVKADGMRRQKEGTS